jgi:hypothetical protein
MDQGLPIDFDFKERGTVIFLILGLRVRCFLCGEDTAQGQNSIDLYPQ